MTSFSLSWFPWSQRCASFLLSFTLVNCLSFMPSYFVNLMLSICFIRSSGWSSNACCCDDTPRQSIPGASECFSMVLNSKQIGLNGSVFVCISLPVCACVTIKDKMTVGMKCWLLRKECAPSMNDCTSSGMCVNNDVGLLFFRQIIVFIVLFRSLWPRDKRLLLVIYWFFGAINFPVMKMPFNLRVECWWDWRWWQWKWVIMCVFNKLPKTNVADLLWLITLQVVSQSSFKQKMHFDRFQSLAHQLVSRYRVPQMLRAKKRMFEIWMLRGTCHSTKHDYFNLIQRSWFLLSYSSRFLFRLARWRVVRNIAIYITAIMIVQHHVLRRTNKQRTQYCLKTQTNDRKWSSGQFGWPAAAHHFGVHEEIDSKIRSSGLVAKSRVEARLNVRHKRCHHMINKATLTMGSRLVAISLLARD